MTQSLSPLLQTAVLSNPVNVMWFTFLAMAALWALVAIVRSITEAVVRTQQHKADVESKYLERMLDELADVRRRLGELQREKEEAPH